MIRENVSYIFIVMDMFIKNSRERNKERSNLQPLKKYLSSFKKN